MKNATIYKAESEPVWICAIKSAKNVIKSWKRNSRLYKLVYISLNVEEIRYIYSIANALALLILFLRD